MKEVRADLSGRFHVNDDGGDHVLTWARGWAEKVVRQGAYVRREQDRSRELFRQAEYGEEWSPTDADLEDHGRLLLMEEVTLIWSASLLEQWLNRLDRELGKTPRGVTKARRTLRNALEHLPDALFDAEGVATADPQVRSPALADLGELDVNDVFNMDVDPLTEAARVFLSELDQELDDVARDYVEQERSDLERGK